MDSLIPIMVGVSDVVGPLEPLHCWGLRGLGAPRLTEN